MSYLIIEKTRSRIDFKPLTRMSTIIAQAHSLAIKHGSNVYVVSASGRIIKWIYPNS